MLAQNTPSSIAAQLRERYDLAARNLGKLPAIRKTPLPRAPKVPQPPAPPSIGQIIARYRLAVDTTRDTFALAIASGVCAAHGMTLDDVRSRRKDKQTNMAREAAMKAVFFRSVPRMTSSQIAEIFNRERSSVSSAVNGNKRIRRVSAPPATGSQAALCAEG